jgi:hypothetical protein
LLFLEPGMGAASVPALIWPLLEREELALVKGFRSQLDGHPDIVARPLINLYRPELAGFVEPLSRNFAARRSLLETLPFPVGDGVSLSLLFDAAEQVGVDMLAQAKVGGDQPCNPFIYSSEAAYAIQAAAANRTQMQGDLVPGPLFLPTSDGLETRRVPLEERPSLANLSLPTGLL